MPEKKLTDMSDRELLLRTAYKVGTIEGDIKELCADRRQHDKRIVTLEKKEAHREGAEEKDSSNTATTIAVIAIIISVVATIGNLLI